MKMAREIAEEALQKHGNDIGANAGFMVISDTDLESVIAAKLEPVKKALDIASGFAFNAAFNSGPRTEVDGCKGWSEELEQDITAIEAATALFEEEADEDSA